MDDALEATTQHDAFIECTRPEEVGELESPEKIGVGINDLPTEILDILFDRYVASFPYLLNCSLVCHRWLEIIGQSIKIMRRFNLIFRNNNLRFINKSEHFMRIYRRVTFIECQFKCIKIQNDINRSKSFEHIEEAAFFDCQYNYKNDLENILCNMKNLKIVLFANREHKNYSKIRKLNLKINNSTKNQNTLQYVHIALHILELVFEELPRNLKLLDNFVSIKDLNAYVYGHEEMLRFIKDNFQEHWTQIIDHSALSSSREHESWMRSIEEMPNLRIKRLEINEFISANVQMQLLETRISSTLTELSLVSPFEDQHFEKMMQLLPNLEVLAINLNNRYGSSYIKPMTKLAKSFPKLHTLRLRLAYETSEPYFDLGLLTNLKYMRRLEFKLPFLQDNQCTLKLTNCTNDWLANIEEFTAFDLVITDAVVGQLFERMKNLVRLSLKSCEQLTEKGLVGAKIMEADAPIPKTINSLKYLEFLVLDQNLINDDLLKEIHIPTLKWLNNGDKLMNATKQGYLSLSENCALLKGKHHQRMVLC